VLFERLAGSFGPPVCVRGDHNRQWRRRYAGHPASFERQLREALPLMAYVVEAVEARNLPGEFALIPIVESGYRPEARGPGGPTGLWQMIGSTARNHGVQVGRGYDGRLSPVDATDAALDYLAVLHAEFGDWRATAMAYNAGEGRLRRAFARDGASRVSGERRLPAGLSSVTYAYVAKLHALACLIAEPARHGLTLPVDAFTPLEARRAPDGATRLDAVARAWGTSPESLARWNPAYRAGIALPGAPRRLLAPVGSAVAMTPIASSSAPLAGNEEAPAEAPRQHTVRSGETLWRIARRYGTTVRALAAFNGIDAARPLRIGRTLRIPD
jgi:membrane-bound lytic murein transglycosylase D